MESARVNFVNKVPPMPQLEFSTWEELSDEMEKCCSENFLLFRARDTQTVKKHNSLAKLQIPNKMQHSYKVFRCTHGCLQKSRSKGLRSTPTRYTSLLSPMVQVVDF
ncbi:hypothetical protein L917_04075 [Phytophthora nicotianae]|uniref:Uncharacterized protein n=1 Tax=Phytophthora nicotianae TaxID=4792 RepID=W2LN67_PHYNI|nr:hypothetical protein L917_04075 [Phytophthora nicotianae]